MISLRSILFLLNNRKLWSDKGSDLCHMQISVVITFDNAVYYSVYHFCKGIDWDWMQLYCLQQTAVVVCWLLHLPSEWCLELSLCAGLCCGGWGRPWRRAGPERSIATTGCKRDLETARGKTSEIQLIQVMTNTINILKARIISDLDIFLNVYIYTNTTKSTYVWNVLNL